MRRPVHSIALAHEKGAFDSRTVLDVVRDLATAGVRGLGQIAFADSPRAGWFVLGAIALVSPPNAVGAALGVGVGTVAGRILPIHSRSEWRLGLAGYNCAIVGLLWGGFIAAGNWQPARLALALSLCILVEAGSRPVLSRVGLPVLSLPAVVTAYAMNGLYAAPGTWFWVSSVSAPLGAPGTMLAVVLVVLAMANKSQTAALQAAILCALCVALLRWQGHPPSAWVGLWAFSVGLSTFAVQGVFLRGRLLGVLGGLMAAAVASAAWFLWQSTELSNSGPPLLVPMTLGVWGTLIVARSFAGTPLADPAFWRIARIGVHALSKDREIVLLACPGQCGQFDSMELGAPAELGGMALDQAATRERLRESRRLRKAWWAACEARRRESREGTPDPAQPVIPRSRRWTGTVITPDVHDAMDPDRLDRVVRLHGRLNAATCVDCHREQPWPPAEIWRTFDLRCPSCAGFLRPAVTPAAEPIPSMQRDRMRERLAGCGLLLVLGSPAATPAESWVLEHARSRAIPLAYIGRQALGERLRMGDLTLRCAEERVLRALDLVLGPLEKLMRSRKLPGEADRDAVDGRSST